ncbi:MAG: hypothetical protein ABI878_03275 [Acidobacteriota bacterium]
MASDDDATSSRAQFHGQDYDGRNLVVNEARPREGNRSADGYRNRDGGYGSGGRGD